MTPRRASRTDDGQAAIVSALRAVGATVEPLHAVGGGVPDLLVGRDGKNWLMEVKAPLGPKGGASTTGQKLNDLQYLWHAKWRGQRCVVRSVDEAVRAVLGRK